MVVMMVMLVLIFGNDVVKLLYPEQISMSLIIESIILMFWGTFCLGLCKRDWGGKDDVNPKESEREKQRVQEEGKKEWEGWTAEPFVKYQQAPSQVHIHILKSIRNIISKDFWKNSGLIHNLLNQPSLLKRSMPFSNQVSSFVLSFQCLFWPSISCYKFSGKTSLKSSLPLGSPNDRVPNTPTINRWIFAAIIAV